MDDQCLLKDGFYLVELVDINLLLFAPIRTSGTFKPMQTRSLRLYNLPSPPQDEKVVEFLGGVV